MGPQGLLPPQGAGTEVGKSYGDIPPVYLFLHLLLSEVQCQWVEVL